MVDHGVIDKSDYNNDYVNKLLEINEYLTKPAFVDLDDEKYLVDYQNDDGYNTYAIINNDNVYGLAYDDKSNAVSIVKDNKVYIMNQEKLLQKYDENDYLEEELNYYCDNEKKLLVYSKLLDNGYSVILRYLANYKDYNVLLNFLSVHTKRPDLIIITKEYFRLGKIDFYKKKAMDLYYDNYITRGMHNIIYSLEETDELLSNLNLPNYIPKDLLNTYLDKDDKIKTLKKVVKKYEETIK